jgi:hypothetical protein
VHDQFYHLHERHSAGVNFRDRARLKLVEETVIKKLISNIFNIFEHQKNS